VETQFAWISGGGFSFTIEFRRLLHHFHCSSLRVPKLNQLFFSGFQCSIIFRLFNSNKSIIETSDYLKCPLGCHMIGLLIESYHITWVAAPHVWQIID
jgi:hypothetical protein